MKPWARWLTAAVAGSGAILLLAAQAPQLPSPAPLPTRAAPIASAPTVTNPAVQPAASDETIATFIDGYMTDAMERGGMPGGAIVVVRDGRTILAKGYGYADIGSRKAVSVEDSLFRQASIAKTFIWVLAMQLVEDGKLDLDRDVNDYIDFRIPDAFGKPITMRHLMTHSAGFTERFWGIYEPDLKTSPAQKLRKSIPARVYAPGSTVAYSNYGAALGAYIVERLRGQPFEQLVEERIFAPAGMRQSTFAQPLPPRLQPLLVSGYRPGSRTPYKFENIATPASGGLTASAGDMGRYLAMLLAGGQAPGGRVIAPETLQRMMRVDKRLGPGMNFGFGHGFMVGEYRGVRYAGHGGNLSAAATDLQMLPDHNIGWYVGFNGPGVGGAASKTRANLIRAVIGRFIAPDPVQVRAQGPSSARDVAGSYLSSRRPHSGPMRLSEPLSMTEVTAAPDGSLRVLSATSADGSPRRWLPAGRDRFVEEETGAPLTVTRDTDGRVAQLASPLVYPVGEFLPAAWPARNAQRLFLAALLVLAFAALAQPAGWALRRGYRPRRSAPRTAPRA